MDNYCELALGGKRGGLTIVSPEDYKFLSKYNWYENIYGYIRGKIGGKEVGMHRVPKTE